MAKKKKKQLHCAQCGSHCEFYKKGKKHRVLVCENCGILATNPIPLAGMALSALAPSLIKKGKEIITGKKESDSVTPQKQTIRHIYDSAEIGNNESKIKLALR